MTDIPDLGRINQTATMISKGNQRAGGQQLATHLLNAHDNERVEVFEVRGAIADDLHGAFAEWSAQARATQCVKYLYSLSINPDQKQGHLTREQYLEFTERVEKKLGLEERSRAVVFHWKKDHSGEAREHCHVVWSRIDAHAGRAVNIAHDRMKLRNVAQDFAKEHDRKLPPGMQADSGTARHEKRADHASLPEKQQEERSGIPKEDRRATLTRAWQQSRDGSSFTQLMRDAGYVLARGDKRSYVVVDRAGEVHSLARQLKDVKATALKVRLEPSHPPEKLPNVEEARAEIATRREKLVSLQRQQPDGPTPDERRAQLVARQNSRRQELAKQRATMTERHADERRTLETLRQTTPFNQVAPRWISLFVRHIASRYQRHQQGRALERRQKNEGRELDRHERNLKSLDMRERRSLEISIRRDDFQSLATEIKRRDAVLERPAISKPDERQPDNRQSDKTAMPTMTPAERRSRLQAAFSAAPNPSLSRLAREEQAQAAGLRRGVFHDVAAPAKVDRAATETERQHELERRRQLEALRHDR